MDKTRTICQKWLVNELVFYFWVLKKCAKAQSNPIILSKVIVLTDVDNNIHCRKSHFFSLSGSQNVKI